MIDRKGITSFLVITFGITYAIEGMLIVAGFRLTGVPPLASAHCPLISISPSRPVFGTTGPRNRTPQPNRQHLARAVHA
jgi:hypothetical protein